MAMVHSATSPSLPNAPDILCHIFSYLDPVHQFGDNDVYESRRSLALAARTCPSRGFASPALDVLWKRLPDDQPLADLLCEVGIAIREDNAQTFKLSGEEKPSHHWLPYQDEGGYPLLGKAEYYEECWRLSRGYDVKYFLWTTGDPRTQPGWHRFVEHVSRVRAITTLFAFDGPAWCTIWEELLAVTDHAPVLPKLQSVAFCYFSSTALNTAAFSLLSPSVRKLNLNIDNEDWSESDVKICGIFTHSFGAAPEIEKLQLECHPSGLGLSLLQTYCSHLHRLEVSLPLDLEAMQLLVQLPALQYLSISLTQWDFSETSLSFAFKGNWETPGLPVIFAELCSLAISCSELRLGVVDPLLTHVEFPRLQSFSLSEKHIEFNNVSEKFPSHLRTGILLAKCPSLTAFAWTSTHIWDPHTGYRGGHRASIAPLAQLVSPLLSHRTLRRFSVQLNGPLVPYTPADFCAFAAAWPDLETFHLVDEEGSSWGLGERFADLESVFAFACYCPRLRSLALPRLEEHNSEALVNAAARRPPAPHWLRELSTTIFLWDEVWDWDRREKIVGQSHGLMQDVFPLVTLQRRGPACRTGEIENGRQQAVQSLSLSTIMHLGLSRDIPAHSGSTPSG
ncbi:hypothetical protein GSI_11545 [Ganoderma sinense ZZ0214-1]|uniref:F-box domain-containing protein n=1 Tax=Ganoderma sinense ZZ0214-1 TaxID=1077348 RepID=A0A2G8RWA1_9APHY|nr:hypothetical protein GSI_11545 [Ganoderma sinense ZZ0214-1]